MTKAERAHLIAERFRVVAGGRGWRPPAEKRICRPKYVKRPMLFCPYGVTLVFKEPGWLRTPDEKPRPAPQPKRAASDHALTKIAEVFEVARQMSSPPAEVVDLVKAARQRCTR